MCVYVCTQPQRKMYPSTNDNYMHSKRKAFVDLSNISSDDETSYKSFKYVPAQYMLPQDVNKENTPVKSLDADRFQNVHPLLPWYKYDLNSSSMSYDAFLHLIDPKTMLE